MPSHSRHHEHYQHQRHHRHPVRAKAHISTPVHDQRCTTCTCRAHLNFETQTKQNICASVKLTVPSGSPSTFSCACKQSDINSNEQLKQVIDMPCEIYPEKKIALFKKNRLIVVRKLTKSRATTFTASSPTSCVCKDTLESPEWQCRFTHALDSKGKGDRNWRQHKSSICFCVCIKVACHQGTDPVHAIYRMSTPRSSKASGGCKIKFRKNEEFIA